tara:strand:+ start:404 stop:634 length:231 start_codon:yes stop_codon:yes gene_type:complete
MILKVGEKVSVNDRTILGKEGVITNISIALSKSDLAGELGVQVKEYDTELNYQGAIDYKTDNGDNYWAYFGQIEKP